MEECLVPRQMINLFLPFLQTALSAFFQETNIPYSHHHQMVSASLTLPFAKPVQQQCWPCIAGLLLLMSRPLFHSSMREGRNIQQSHGAGGRKLPAKREKLGVGCVLETSMGEPKAPGWCLQCALFGVRVNEACKPGCSSMQCALYCGGRSIGK